MIRSITCVAFFIMAPTVFGATSKDDLLACVDEDVRATLVDNGQLYSTISRDLPEEISALNLDDNLGVIGSRRIGPSQVVAFKMKLDATQASDSFTREMAKDQWTATDLSTQFQMGGFKSPIWRNKLEDSRTLQFCHVSKGAFSAAFSEAKDGNAYLVIHLAPKAAGNFCDSPEKAMMAQMMEQARLADHPKLPELHLPEDASTSELGHSGGDSGNRYSRISFKSKLDADALVAFFKEQLNKQGWTTNHQWRGGQTTSVALTSNAQEATGLMSITFRPGDTVQALLQAQSTAANSAALRIIDGLSGS